MITLSHHRSDLLQTISHYSIDRSQVLRGTGTPRRDRHVQPDAARTQSREARLTFREPFPRPLKLSNESGHLHLESVPAAYPGEWLEEDPEPDPPCLIGSPDTCRPDVPWQPRPRA